MSYQADFGVGSAWIAPNGVADFYWWWWDGKSDEYEDAMVMPISPATNLFVTGRAQYEVC